MGVHLADPKERARVSRLREAGVSIWLDSLSRDLLASGEFEELVTQLGVTGATSNPTIFERAITGSRAYDDALAELRGTGARDAVEAFLALALEDVRNAAALLAPAHERSGGTDGFVSFECTPDLAYDLQGTVAQALDLWRRLGRANVMIKVPATAPGVGAIEALVARGVNVNVTLLFSVDRYAEVIDAYLSGLERRGAAGLPLDSVTSVASFFVSRIDTKADAALPETSPLRGEVAIANAQRAYALFAHEFSGARWQRLAAAGAKLQRPLWASTGTKDPAYSDVRYVERLIARHAINTMPLDTLMAFADHGDPEASLRGGVDGERTLAQATEAGVDLQRITSELEREGVTAFERSYDALLGCLASRLAR